MAVHHQLKLVAKGESAKDRLTRAERQREYEVRNSDWVPGDQRMGGRIMKNTILQRCGTGAARV